MRLTYISRNRRELPILTGRAHFFNIAVARPDGIVKGCPHFAITY
jgi:hypothetical protein